MRTVLISCSLLLAGSGAQAQTSMIGTYLDLSAAKRAAVAEAMNTYSVRIYTQDGTELTAPRIHERHLLDVLLPIEFGCNDETLRRLGQNRIPASALAVASDKLGCVRRECAARHLRFIARLTHNPHPFWHP